MDIKEIKKEDEKKEGVKKDRYFKKKDLIFTAIVAFLVGAIITATGFTIAGKTHKRGDFRDFKQDGIQRQIDPNGADGMQRRGRGGNNDGSNMQKPEQNGQSSNSGTQETPNNPPAQDGQGQPEAQNNTNQRNSVS